jgi:hypothetical protein
MDKQLKWAAKTLLDLCNIPASPTYLRAFEQHQANERWIKAVIRQAEPVTGSMTNGLYVKAVDICKDHGINVNPFTD